MREFTIEEFVGLDDAIMWLEKELYDLEPHTDFLKGELVKIDGKWRAAVEVDDGQGELNV